MLGRLPTEVLARVLRTLIHDDMILNRLQMTILALVCRRFRDIVCPFMYAVLECSELGPEEDPCSFSGPAELDFSKIDFAGTEVAKNPCKAALVKHVQAYHYNAPIDYLVQFTNLRRLTLVHYLAHDALKVLPLRSDLFPRLQDFEVLNMGDSLTVSLSTLARIWVQRTLRNFVVKRFELKNGKIPIGFALPSVQTLKLRDCHCCGTVDFSPMLSIRNAENLILECNDHELDAAMLTARPSLLALTLVVPYGADKSLASSLNTERLQKLSLNMRTFLGWEYGKDNLSFIGKDLYDLQERESNALESLHLEHLTIIFDGHIENDHIIGCPIKYDDMIWTPATFRYISFSLQKLSSAIGKVTFEFEENLYRNLQEDFGYCIEKMLKAGRDGGLGANLTVFRDEDFECLPGDYGDSEGKQLKLLLGESVSCESSDSEG